MIALDADEVLEGAELSRADSGLTMAQLAIAWVLQNDNVATAIIGATRPQQVVDNVEAAGVALEPELLTKIDDVLGEVVERDPARTLESSPKTREA
jgi:aryl-alcohol dehydrogenase-like predicted oxidoreductase